LTEEEKKGKINQMIYFLFIIAWWSIRANSFMETYFNGKFETELSSAL
jgi:hypothetical protein